MLCKPDLLRENASRANVLFARVGGRAFHRVGHSFSQLCRQNQQIRNRRRRAFSAARSAPRFSIFETWDGSLDSREPVITRVPQQARDTGQPACSSLIFPERQSDVPRCPRHSISLATSLCTPPSWPRSYVSPVSASGLPDCFRKTRCRRTHRPPQE